VTAGTGVADSALAASDLIKAALVAAGLSILIALIEIPRRAREQVPGVQLRACLSAASVLYCTVLVFGNVVTTLLASTAVVKLPTGLSPYYYLFAAFFGVFAFETVLKNTNITMFDKGVLTIQSWIEKALNSAITETVGKQNKLNEAAIERRAQQLMALDEIELNTRILNTLGEDVVIRLEVAAKKSHASAKLYKALRLAAMEQEKPAPHPKHP
jgi:hypothetical protein